MGDYSDLPPAKYFTPGSTACLDYKGTLVAPSVSPQTRCPVCQSTMCRIGDNTGYAFCINESCSQSKTNYKHSKSFAWEVTKRHFIYFIMFIFSVVLASENINMVDFDLKDNATIGGLILSVVMAIGSMYFMVTTSSVVYWNDIAKREDAINFPETKKTKTSVMKDSYNRYQTPTRSTWTTVTYKHIPKKTRLSVTERRARAIGIAMRFPQAKQET